MNLSESLKSVTEKSNSGLHREALHLCEEMLSEFPDSDSYRIYSARSAVYHGMKEYQNAFSDLDRVIKLMPNPNIASPFFRKGCWNLEIGNYEDAIKNLSKVIEFQDSYFIDAAYYYRADAYLKCSEYENVLSDCEHVPDGYFIEPHQMTTLDFVEQANKGLRKSR